MLRLSILAVISLVLVGCGSPEGRSVPSTLTPLKPQQFTWYPERAKGGPVLVYVSIPRQEAMVYRNGIRIGRAACSTGKPGHSTPTGVFQILQKDIDHRSSTYDNAPMPYMNRLTWSGVAMHTGFNPGHPASHGCIRLPDGFAKELYKITHVGGTVIITDSNKIPTLTLTKGPGSSGSGSGTWSNVSKSGATSFVVSIADRQAAVFQNGKRVASTPIEVSGGLQKLKGEEAFLYASDQEWHTIVGNDSVKSLKKDVRIPDGFRAKLLGILHPGTTMVVTSEPIGTRGGTSRNLMSVE